MLIITGSMQTTQINSMKPVLKLHNYTNDQFKQIINTLKHVNCSLALHLTNLNNKRERETETRVSGCPSGPLCCLRTRCSCHGNSTLSTATRNSENAPVLSSANSL